jgi:hypothetical protein
MRDSVSIEYTLSADLPLGFLHMGGGGGAHKKATKEMHRTKRKKLYS